MKNNLLFLTANLLFWYFILVVARVLFLLVYAHADNALTFNEGIQTFIYGFRLDMGIAAYTSLPIAIILIFKNLTNKRFINYIYFGYILLAITVYVIIISSDLVMYKYWNFRLDATPLFYLGNIGAATASVSISKIIFVILGIISCTILLFYLYLRLFLKTLNSLATKFKSLFILIPALAILFVIMRGGIGIASLATSSAYFSEKQFCNHAAINPLWNVGFSITEKDDLKKEYTFFEANELKELLRPYTTELLPGKSLLKTDRPNVILIITESLTAKALAYGGDTLNVMPGLNRLIKEGILFDKVYAAAERTDKGLAAIISGYPSMPGSSPLIYQRLTENLSFFPKKLRNAGYKTEFYYGGTLDFANYGSFIMQAGYQKTISDKDFPSSELESKWGAYDHIVSNKLLQNTPNQDSGFFKTFLTLTSHEPFVVPIPAFLPGSSDETLFLNSLHYTDQVLDTFVTKAKTMKWWNNTIIIITADHGSQMPNNSKNWEEARFHIPVIWLGGALNVTDTIISVLSSQTDIAATLLAQLKIKEHDFDFSKNILSPTYKPRAFFTFTGGFGWLRADGFSVFNTITNKYNDKQPYIENQEEKSGKAYLQFLFEDFKKKYNTN